MEFALVIYLIDVLTDTSGVRALLAISSIVLAISTIWFLGYTSNECEVKSYRNKEKADENLKFAKDMYARFSPLKWVVGILMIYLFLIPSKDTAYRMLAAYGVQSVVNNEKVQEFAGSAYQVLDKAMKDYLNETPSSEPKK